ncbi:hypothetical protein PHYPO_G00059640 [Pangasianodon hypophthalmus]|uniref:C3/C5 convertase n=1 Tax=Pangasianodon hypophthalmus TaxID=310915 RepID=A0A5N5M134_PANHP|nr:hypothetical protein PHYPO_G00059640 [Pangasianodon hypophthalmus]
MGLWSSFIFVICLCPIIIGVPSLPQCPKSNLAISGGSFTLSKMYNDRSILRYICPEGYYPHPVKRRDCKRGRWHPAPTTELPVCKNTTCPNPNGLENGVVFPNRTFYYVNDTTTYKCLSNYTFRGSPTRVCQMNGKWSGRMPVCAINTGHCPDPGTPPGASRQGHIFNTDDKVTYSCDNKLKLLGSRVRVCQDDGYWSGKEPECYADFTYDTPEEVGKAFGSSLMTTLNMHEQPAQPGKKIRLSQPSNLDIYIALDASDSIEEEDFNKTKEVIKKLLVLISYYEVLPNYEIITFATNVAKIVSNGYSIQTIFKSLDHAEGQKSGSNIGKVYKTILDCIRLKKTRDKKNFKDIHHVIIMFTDGVYNIGGNPKTMVEQIKEIVYDGDERNREELLDSYVFGVGVNVPQEAVNDWVTKRAYEKYLYLLPNMKNVPEILYEMTDETTSVRLCGLYKDSDDGTESAMRNRYPWLIKIVVTHEDGTTSNCLGSLVTPMFILTAAHCFRTNDIPEKIKVEAPYAKETRLANVENYILHPNFKFRGNTEGISKYYDYDVALIEMKWHVKISPNLRTICIPCTKEMNAALKLSTSDTTCQEHKEILMNNNLIKGYLMSAKGQGDYFTKSKVLIKQQHQLNGCTEDVKKALKITDEAGKNITDNFLCTGGMEQSHVSYKGDSGGATFVQLKSRMIQVGIVSWGLKDVHAADAASEETARDFHTNLFSPEVQAFLKQYLGDEITGEPLTFLE